MDGDFLELEALRVLIVPDVEPPNKPTPEGTGGRAILLIKAVLAAHGVHLP
jgi:hypothetical protein